MDTNGMTPVMPLVRASLLESSRPLIILLILLILALIAGVLIVFLTRKRGNSMERPPVFGAEIENNNDNETSQGVDMSVPGAEDLTLSQEEISTHPVPQLGHPDDEGVPVPKYDEEAKSLVVDTDVAPVDVNANVPVPPPSEAADNNTEAPVDGTDTIEEPPADTVQVWTTTGGTLFSEADEAPAVSEEIPEKAEQLPEENEETVMENTANENDNLNEENAKAASSDFESDAKAVPNTPFDSVKAKFEEVKEKTTAFLEGEGEDAPFERIKRAALDAKDKAEEKAVELKDKAYEIATSEQAQELRSSLEAKAEEAKEKAVQLWAKAKESAEDENSFLGQAKRAANDVKEKAEDYFNKGNPRKDTGENAE